ncbi:MAG: DNA translocase FtsK [Bacilli bacterium]
MENETKEKKSLSTYDFIQISIGIILISLSIIAATSQTPVGEFLAYSLAYLFGVFYPFVLAFIVVCGIRLIYSKKLFPLKGKSMFWIGLVLVALASLAFGSYSFILSNPHFSFSEIINVYSDRILSFARYPFQIDNFGALGSLGGGFIGTFLIALFGTVWSSIGDAIFFSLILIFGLFMVSFDSLKKVYALVQEKKAQKVSYTSPFKDIKPGEENEKKLYGIDDEPVSEKIHSSYSQGGFIVSGSSKREQIDFGSEEKEPEPERIENPYVSALADEKKNDLLLSDDQVSASPSVSNPFTPTPITPVQPQSLNNPYAQPTQPNPYQAPNTNPYSQPQPNMNNPYVPQPNPYTNPNNNPYAQPNPYMPQPQANPYTPPVNSNNPYQQQPNPYQAPNGYANPSPYQQAPVNPNPYPTNPQPNPYAQGQINSNPAYQPQPNPYASSNNNPYNPTPSNPSQPTTNKDTYARQASSFDSLLAQKESSNDSDFLSENERESNTIDFNSDNSNSNNNTDSVEVVLPSRDNSRPKPAEEAMDKATASELYYAYKAKKEMEAQQRLDLEKKQKMASVLQYVSSSPISYKYALPTDSLLSNIDDSYKRDTNIRTAKEKAAIIDNVFHDFNFPAMIKSITVGASVTRFNVQTEPGVKADKIETFVSDVQRALNGDQSVRILSVVEGCNTSGVEVGNSEPMAVAFKDIFTQIEKDTEHNLLIPIGKDINGKIITHPLDDMPHLLVAGTTGSGKSVLINCMIMTLIMRNYPSQLKLMLIDPKQVEFAKYNLEPHLFCPVIQDSQSAIIALRKMCDEMDRRYSVLKQNGCVKISEYRMLRKGREDTLAEIPDLVVVIDEFADLMNTGGSEIAGYVQRITQKSRAAGIYMIIATQRPSKDAIPMIIKSNIICRIGLACSSQVDSRVILDENGCEALVGRGDLLFKCPGHKSLQRCQSAFISNQDMDQVLSYLRQMGGNPNYDPNFIDLQPEDEGQETVVKSSEEVYQDVKDYVMITGICGRSEIMKEFSLSYLKVDNILLNLRNEGVIQLIQGGKSVVVRRMRTEG